MSQHSDILLDIGQTIARAKLISIKDYDPRIRALVITKLEEAELWATKLGEK